MVEIYRKPQLVAGAPLSVTFIPNNRKSSFFNGYGYRCIDSKSGLFQPSPFEKKEGSDWVTAVRLAFERIVPVAFADFESAVFHGCAPLIGSFNECP